MSSDVSTAGRLSLFAKGPRTALACREGVWTFDRLHDDASAFADRLNRHLGIGAGHRVVMTLGNSPEFVIGLIALVSLRASAVLLGPHFTGAELADAVDRTRSVGLLASRHQSATASSLLSEVDVTPGAVRDGADIACFRTQYAAVSAGADEVTIQFTSGSTGRARLVPRTVAHLVDELSSLASVLTLGPEDATLCPCPLNHAYGLVDGLLLPLFTGRTTVLLSSFLPSDVADAARDHRPRMMIGVPTMYRALCHASSVQASDLSSLQIFLSSGAPLSNELDRAFRERFGGRLRQQYGSTETGAIAIDAGAGPVSSAECVGAPLPGRVLLCVNERGEPEPVGETGEIVVQSGSAAEHYLDDPDATADRFVRGCFLTRDRGHMNTSGQLFVTGRASSVINVGGRKIDPLEVQQVLERFESVIECAVLRVPGVTGEDAIKAVIVARRHTSVAELRSFCQQYLAQHKIPHTFEFVDALPRTVTGKVVTKDLL